MNKIIYINHSPVLSLPIVGSLLYYMQFLMIKKRILRNMFISAKDSKQMRRLLKAIPKESRLYCKTYKIGRLLNLVAAPATFDQAGLVLNGMTVDELYALMWTLLYCKNVSERASWGIKNMLPDNYQIISDQKNINNNCLIVIPLADFESWNWSADYMRQSVLALSKKGYKLAVYLDQERYFLFPAKNSQTPNIKNVCFYHAFNIFPFRRFKLIKRLNRTLNLAFIFLKDGLGKKIIFWAFNPEFYDELKFVSSVPGLISLYDCVDYYGSQDSQEDKFRKELERRFIKSVNFFFVNSHALFSLHKKVRPAYIVPQGFDIDSYKQNSTKNSDFYKTKPRIGFVGTMDFRLDLGLLLKVIRNCPKFEFVLWGPVDKNYFENNPSKKRTLAKILSLANVVHGKSPRSKIPGIISGIKVGMIPYDVSKEFCKYCYPMKVFEYFYMGKKVISTPIYELTRFGKLIKVTKNADEWTQYLKKAVLDDPSPGEVDEKRKLAEANSWNIKVGKMLDRLQRD